MVLRRSWNRPDGIYALGLVAIALFTFHGLSSLVFTALVLAPSSPQWTVALVLAILFMVAGATVGIQSLQSSPTKSGWLPALISGASSMALVFAYLTGQLAGQKAAVLGVPLGILVGGGLGIWTTRRAGFERVVMALIGSLCAYGAAFGLSGWTIAAATSQRWGIMLALGLLAVAYLWITQRSLKWTYYQWQNYVKKIRRCRS